MTSINIITTEVLGILATKKYVEAHQFPAHGAKYGLSPECFDIIKVLYERMTDEDEVKSLGHMIFEKGGYLAMMATIYLLKHALKDADIKVASWPRVIEMWWDGIGGWQA
jgi:hypothetical protein